MDKEDVKIMRLQYENLIKMPPDYENAYRTSLHLIDYQHNMIIQLLQQLTGEDK